jgi:hypothetical protein
MDIFLNEESILKKASKYLLDGANTDYKVHLCFLLTFSNTV